MPAARRRTGSTRRATIATSCVPSDAGPHEAPRRRFRRHQGPQQHAPSGAACPGTTSSSTATTASDGTARGSAVPRPRKSCADGAGPAPRPCRSSGRSRVRSAPPSMQHGEHLRPGDRSAGVVLALARRRSRSTRARRGARPRGLPQVRLEGAASRSGAAAWDRCRHGACAGRQQLGQSRSPMVHHERRDLRLHDARGADPRPRATTAPSSPARACCIVIRSARSACRRPRRAGSPPSRDNVGQIEHVDPAASPPGGARRSASSCWCSAPVVINRVLDLDSLPTAADRRRRGRAADADGRPGRHPAGRASVGARWPLFYIAAGVPRLVIGTALILWRPTESSAVLGVGIGYVRPGARRLVGAARTRDARAAAPEHTGSRRCSRRASTTPRRSSPSSRCPTSTSSSRATCSTSTTPGSTPAG